MTGSKTEIWDVVKAYSTGGRDSVVVCIPHQLRKERGISPGQRFVVRTDEEGRLIFEPLESGKVKNEGGPPPSQSVSLLKD